MYYNNDLYYYTVRTKLFKFLYIYLLYLLLIYIVFVYSVIEGVKLYKSGGHNEALIMYNKALDIDVDNVEALVARGAL